jgi:hypothetical protein
VKVLSGDTGKGEFFTFSSGDVASLVFPFVSGTMVEAQFSFTKGEPRMFVSQWPAGAPMPPAMGKFIGQGQLPSSGGGNEAACLACSRRVMVAEGCRGKDIYDPAWDGEICARATIKAMDAMKTTCRSECAE